MIILLMLKSQLILTPSRVNDRMLLELTAVKDVLEVLGGSSKLPIIIALLDGNKNFKEICKIVPHISTRMLSKEMKDLEFNKLVKRIIYDSPSPTLEYSVTEHAKTLRNVIIALREWGKIHQKEIISR